MNVRNELLKLLDSTLNLGGRGLGFVDETPLMGAVPNHRGQARVSQRAQRTERGARVGAVRGRHVQELDEHQRVGSLEVSRAPRHPEAPVVRGLHEDVPVGDVRVGGESVHAGMR